MTEKVADTLDQTLIARAKSALTEKNKDVFYTAPADDNLVKPILSEAGWERKEIVDDKTPGGKSIVYTKPKI
jgi:hypothetical protein